jgi:hypothetical protein
VLWFYRASDTQLTAAQKAAHPPHVLYASRNTDENSLSSIECSCVVHEAPPPAVLPAEEASRGDVFYCTQTYDPLLNKFQLLSFVAAAAHGNDDDSGSGSEAELKKQVNNGSSSSSDNDDDDDDDDDDDTENSQSDSERGTSDKSKSKRAGKPKEKSDKPR